MKLRIRPMTAEDKPAIMAILRATPEFKPSEVIVAEEVIDYYLNDPSAGYFTLVGETDSAIAGYVCFGLTPVTEGTWDIYWIAVAPGQQGKGIGGTLLTVTGDKIKQLGGRMMIAETSSTPEYEKTRCFYLSHGYQRVAQITDFYAPGDDIVFFQKRL